MSSLPTPQSTSSPLFRWFQRLLRRLLRRNVQSIHQRFFQWYNATFFPITDHLTPLELAYIHRCFTLSQWFAERAPESDYEGFSYFTYSHRVSGEHVNSSRVAFGSVEHPDEMLLAALPILKQRQIETDPYFLIHENARFYGLGWDLDEGHFKTYFRILNLDALPQPSLRNLLADTLPRSLRRPEGLVSFTYANHQLYEEKVYAYPLPAPSDPAEVFPGAKSRVLMATSRRGVITQYDVSRTETWRHKLNPTGQRLIDTYAKHGYTLDTIVLSDNDHFTLYFPGAFIPLLSTVSRLRRRT